MTDTDLERGACSRELTFRIFISSPGDVAEERDKARQVVAALQRHYGGEVTLLPILWEDLPLGADTSFQQGIDLVLSREQGIDIAVFILWSRLGSPLGAMVTSRDGAPYRSGTERELDLLFEARRQSGGERPHILAYVRKDDDGFKRRLQSVPSERLEEEVRQQRLAQEFIAESFHDTESHTNLRAFHTYPEPVTFSTRLKVHLRELIDARLESTAPQARLWEGEPYRAFDVFEVEHADIYFGREREVADLETLLRRRRECAFVAVVGASGSGKSSLVRAGLASTLLRFNFDESVAQWRHAIMTPGACDGDLILGLSRCLCADTALSELRANGLTPEVLAESFAESPQATLRLAVAPAFQLAAASRPGAVKLLLIVDQLEELHTDRRLTSQSRDQFYRCLHALATSGQFWVVATLRSDFYSLAQQDRSFLELKGSDGQMDLLPPEPSALRRMIAEPARLAGLSWEKDERTVTSLDQILLDDVAAQPDALPLLEFTLNELYQRRSGRTLTVSAYHDDLGGLEGAVGRRAESVYAALSDEARAALPNLFRELVALDPESGGRPVRRRASYDPADSQSPLGVLTSALIGARLLTAGESDAGSELTLAHDALLKSWSRLVAWTASNLAHLRLRAPIEADYRRWESLGQEESLLIPSGLRLEEARTLVLEAPELVEEEVREYVFASIAAAAREAEERAERMRQTSMALAHGYHIKANQSLEKDDPGRALLWLSQAIRVVPDGNSLATNLRIAFGQVLRRHSNVFPLFMVGHAGPVNHVTFSPCGTHIATASDDWTATVWEVSTGRPVGMGLHHDERVLSIAFSPDGGRVVTASWDGTARVWDAATGELIGEPLDHETPVVDASFSPDGLRIVTTSSNSTARLWDSATGRLLSAPLRDDDYSKILAFSPDCTRVLTSDRWSRSVRVWETANGEPLSPVFDHDDDHSVDFGTFSPDGARVITKTSVILKSSGTVRIWDAVSGQLASELIGHVAFVNDCAFNLEGSQVVTSCARGVRVWDAATGALLSENLTHHDLSAVGISGFSPDGTQVVTAGEKTARIWDLLTGQVVGAPLRHANGVVDIKFSPNGALIATASMDGTARVWSATTDARTDQALDHGNSKVRAVGSNGALILLAHGDDRFRVWESVSRRALGDEFSHECIENAAFSPNGTRVITTGGLFTAAARIWDVATGQLLSEIPEGYMNKRQKVTSASFSPDGTYFVAVCYNETARVWDAVSGHPVGVPLKHKARVNSAQFSPDGMRVVSASKDNTARVWDPATGRAISAPMRHLRGVDNAIFSLDATLVVTTSGTVARVWLATTGQPLGEDLCHSDSLYSATLSPDNTRVLTVSQAGTVWIWHTETSRLSYEPIPHENVRGAAFSPDGTRIVTSSHHGARVWDAATGQPICELLECGDGLVYAAFSADGHSVVTVDWIGTVRTWPFPIDAHSVEVLVLAGEVSSGQMVTNDGLLGGILSGGEIAERYRLLREIAPDLFPTRSVA